MNQHAAHLSINDWDVFQKLSCISNVERYGFQANIKLENSFFSAASEDPPHLHTRMCFYRKGPGTCGFVFIQSSRGSRPFIHLAVSLSTYTDKIATVRDWGPANSLSAGVAQVSQPSWAHRPWPALLQARVTCEHLTGSIVLTLSWSREMKSGIAKPQDEI